MSCFGTRNGKKISDKKMVNFDGSNSNNYYWHDLRQNSHVLCNGRWEVICLQCEGVCVQRGDGKMNTSNYQQMIYKSPMEVPTQQRSQSGI